MDTTSKPLKGIVVPVITPFYEGGEFAFPMLELNIERLSLSGIHGFLALGPAAEPKSLSATEKLDAIKCIARHMKKNQVLIVASIFESTRETVEFAVRAESLGAEYIVLSPPSFYAGQMSDETLIRYFVDVASAVGVPCILLNVPQFSGGYNINQDVIDACAAHSNIIGIVDSSMSGIEKIIANAPENFYVLSGAAHTFISALINGGAGGVVPLANSHPVIALDVYDAFSNHDFTSLQALNRKMICLDGALSGLLGVAAIKFAMDKNGFYGGPTRLPLLPLADDEKTRLDKAIDDILL